MRSDTTINCPKHGTVPLSIDPDLGADVQRVCPVCEHEVRNPQYYVLSPYPLQGTSPSVIPELNRGD